MAPPSFLAALLMLSIAPGGLAMPNEQRIEDDARQSLAVTIYNEDLALVKDRRQAALEDGENRLAWRKVSARIRPETALLTETSGRLPVSLLEQNFDFDLLTPESLLKKYVGREVRVIRTNDAGERVTEEARVLAANAGVVLRYADRIETGVAGHLAFPDVPENLRDQPTLVLHLQAARAGRGDFELSYLTGGLAWRADYVADLAPDGQSMNLNGWVTLTNASGIAYPGARVQLVAGEVNQVREAPPAPMMRAMAMGAAPDLPVQETLDEYHLYTLPRPTDILDNQTKQVALLSAPDAPIERALTVTGEPWAYRAQTSADGWTRLPVVSTLEFVNQGGSLGIPLPKGIVRVYARDRQGNAQFVGEDAMDHTPRNERVSLRLGESFDVTARRRQTEFRKLGGASAHDYTYEAAFELELRNAKDAPARVRLIEQIPGDWTMVSESQPHTKAAANLASWTLEVPPEGAVTLAWRTRVRH